MQLMQSLTQEYLCPILRVTMNDPVLTFDGHTYEKQAIENWFKTSQKSPVTGLKLQSVKLIPNIALKNLKDKISELVPKQLKQLEKLKSENQKLKNILQEMKLQSVYLKQLNDSKQIVIREYSKQLQIKQKALNLRTSQFNNKSQIVQKLEEKNNAFSQEIQTLKKQRKTQQKSLKKEIEQLTTKLQKNQKQNKQKIQNIFNGIKYNISFLQQLTENIMNIFLIVLHRIFEQINSQESQVKQKLLKIDQEIEKCLKTYYHDYCLSYYKNYKFIVQNFTLEKLISNQVMIFPHLNIEIQYEYSSVYDFTTVETLFRLEEIAQKNHQNIQYYQQFITKVQGIQDFHLHINDKEWQQILKIAPKYPNIFSIVLQDSQFKQLKKSDLLKFPKLKYLSLKRNNLNEQSIAQLQSYKTQNPQVIIISDRSSLELQENQYYEDQLYSEDQYINYADYFGPNIW